MGGEALGTPIFAWTSVPRSEARIFNSPPSRSRNSRYIGTEARWRSMPTSNSVVKADLAGRPKARNDNRPDAQNGINSDGKPRDIAENNTNPVTLRISELLQAARNRRRKFS